MGAISVRRRNRRAVGLDASYNWPDCWVIGVQLQTNLTTEAVVEFSQPMVSTPFVGAVPYWNMRYWDTSGNTTVVVPFQELQIVSATQQIWISSAAFSVFAPYSLDLPVEWDNFRPVGGGRVRGYAPAFGPSQAVTFTVWP